MRPIYLISKTPFPGVIHIPVLQTRFFTPFIDFSQYDFLIVTSKQVLDALAAYSDETWKKIPIIAVSEPTAKVFSDAGCTVCASAEGYGEGIGDIVREIPSKRFLYLRAAVVASEWAARLREEGFDIEERIVYETGCVPTDMPIDESGILIFTSPSTIRCFCENRTILSTHIVIAIGETTRSALPEGINALLPKSPSVAATVDLARRIG